MAVVVVTTALCADHVAIAAPTSCAESHEIAGMAGRIVSRLAQHLRRVIPTAVRSPDHVGAKASQEIETEARPASLPVPARPGFSPFQFRLPPPVL